VSKIQAECLYVVTRGDCALPALVLLDGVLHLPVFERICDALRFMAKVCPVDCSVALCEDILALQELAHEITDCRGMVLDPLYDEASGEWRYGLVETVEPTERKAG
jgi:hypothetical protein